MTKQNPFQNGEISFLELAKYFFDFKVLIAVCAIIGAIGGVGWNITTPTRYTVDAAYVVNIYPAPVRDLCGSTSAGGSLNKFLDCLEQQVVEQLKALSTDTWVFDQSILTETTTAPKSADVYEERLREIEAQYNALIVSEYQMDLEIIAAELDARILTTETISGALLDAKRNLKMISDGRSAISFKPVVIKKVSKNLLTFTFVTSLLGAIVGMLAALSIGIFSKNP